MDLLHTTTDVGLAILMSLLSLLAAAAILHLLEVLADILDDTEVADDDGRQPPEAP